MSFQGPLLEYVINSKVADANTCNHIVLNLEFLCGLCVQGFVFFFFFQYY